MSGGGWGWSEMEARNYIYSSTYLLQVRRRETVHTEHHGRATDERGGDQNDVIVNLLDGAEHKARNGASYI